MLYLTSASTLAVRELQQEGVIGKMVTPLSRSARASVKGLRWGIDNGCFLQGDRFDAGGYLRWLDKLPRDGCLFATAPDVVGNAEATLARSRDVLTVIRSLGYPAAMVAQDGLERMTVPWETFDALFIGGTTDWKLSEASYALIGEAKTRGKHVHCGRVNSWPRFRAMAMAGCDSADGTTLAFAPDRNLARLREWIEQMGQQMAFAV